MIPTSTTASPPPSSPPQPPPVSSPPPIPQSTRTLEPGDFGLKATAFVPTPDAPSRNDWVRLNMGGKIFATTRLDWRGTEQVVAEALTAFQRRSFDAWSRTSNKKKDLPSKSLSENELAHSSKKRKRWLATSLVVQSVLLGLWLPFPFQIHPCILTTVSFDD